MQSFSSDGSSSGSGNENEEQNQSKYACKTSLSQNTNELSGELASNAKQLVSSADEPSINANSCWRTQSGSKSKSDCCNDKTGPPSASPLDTVSQTSKKSWCTAALVDGDSRVSPNPNAGLPANTNFGQSQRQFLNEVPWWLDPNSDNVPEGVERHLSAASDDISQDTTISTVLPDDGNFFMYLTIVDTSARQICQIQCVV